MQLLDDDYCFACGKKNPHGLRLDFSYDDEGIFSYFIPAREHQGYKDIIHGGIISTILDEVMARMLIDRGMRIMTVKMEIRYRKPVLVGKRLMLRAELVSEGEKFVYARGKLLSAEGQIMAVAHGTFARIQGVAPKIKEE